MWMPKEITAIHGSTLFTLKLNDERVVRKHVDQLRNRVNTSSPSDSDNMLSDDNENSQENSDSNTASASATKQLEEEKTIAQMFRSSKASTR